MASSWSLWFVALGLVGCVAATDGAPAGRLSLDPDASALVVLPDTQFYACAYPEIFAQQTRWIAQMKSALHLGLVLHTGDIVDTDIDPQWRVAFESMSLLADELPYLITTGNHDLSPERASRVPSYFQTRALHTFDIEAEAYEPGRIDNSYAVVRLSGHDWLVLGLEFGPRDRIVDWAAGVLEEHADLPAILFTHAYLYSDGQRYDRRRSPAQPYHPDLYGQTPEQGINDGEDLWRRLIEPHENVRLVLSGHVIPKGTARASVQRASGSVVHQVLANYQLCDACPCAEVEGGGGYLRVLTFAGDGIRVQTYSPHYDRYLTDDDNDFMLASP